MNITFYNKLIFHNVKLVLLNHFQNLKEIAFVLNYNLIIKKFIISYEKH